MDSETTSRLYCIALALIGVIIYSSLIYLALKLKYCFRRRRLHAAAERILDSAADVPYLPLPETDDQLQDASNSSSSCVICMAEYERGEGRFVMPGCCHAFHRGCIAVWLRQGKTTCPICRVTATVAVVVGSPPPAAGEEGVVAAGVGVSVSTAEDMV